MRSESSPRRRLVRRIAALVLVAIVVTTACQLGADPERVAAGGSDGVDDQIVLAYRDVTGGERRIATELRLPGRPVDDSLPVVVWSHGGSRGKSDPARVANAWGAAFTSAGFAFVAVAHPGRTPDDRRAVCDAVRAEACDEFNTLLWDRPHDVGVVFDWIESQADHLRLDPSRIVYGGHSAGAIGVFTTVGMAWPFGSELAPPSDPRPVAFVAASPPGAAARDLSAGRLADIDRPLLLLTGVGDTTSGTDATDRRATFALLPADPTSFLLWVDDPRSRHSVFNLETKACERAGGTPRACRAMVRTVGRVGIVFATAAVDSSGYDADALDTLVSARLGPRFDWSATGG